MYKSSTFKIKHSEWDGYGQGAPAACKPQGNQHLTILKTSWKSKPDLIMAINLFNKIILSIQTG